MGTVCMFRRASDDDIDLLLCDPRLIAPFFSGDAEVPRPAGFLARLFRRRAPAEAPARWRERGDDDLGDVEKAWHGLHYLFTGTAWQGEEPAASLVTGGEEIRDGGVGYGPSRALRPAAVRRFADFLSTFDRQSLLDRFDRTEMTALDIYPAVWEDEEDDEAFEYLWDHFELLRDFMAAAAERGDGVVIYLG